jgi:AraC family transcriptional regulator, regulatory protein of adaptative response / DNA-3-methyladenine glycosylase II
MNAAPDAQHDSRYSALCAKDARFDGQWFVGVTSTGVYCRPVCRVRTPLARNCRFFDLAALAEQAGFRPCMKCRPELSPRVQHWSAQDAASILAQAAMRAIDAQATQSLDLGHIAQTLGVSERHMRRVFEARVGVSPLQYAQTRRLWAAKQLLTDTALPIADVAFASGFESVRRFNDVFVAAYRMSPGRLRREGDGAAAPLPSGGLIRLTPWRIGWISCNRGPLTLQK